MSNKNVSMIILAFAKVEECFRWQAALQLPHVVVSEVESEENEGE
jgi:hypothetical protein